MLRPLPGARAGKEEEMLVDSLRTDLREFLALGTEPPVPHLEVLDVTRADGYSRQSIRYENDQGEPIEAFFFEPLGARLAGAVVVLHQHNSEWHIGKSEVAGLAGDPLQAFGPALARRGVCVLAPDAVGFESRRGPAGAWLNLAPPAPRPSFTAEGWVQYYNHAMHRLVRGELLMTQVLRDAARAVGVLSRLTETTHVGVAGHSYGGAAALFAAAVDPRIGFACSSGAVCSYRKKLASGIGLDMALVIPGFARRFDFDTLMQCIAPRSLLVVSSENDPYAADAAELVAGVRPSYLEAGRAAGLRHVHSGTGHALDPERSDAIIEWLAARAAE
jgi:dienelactone hydrolase